MKGQGNKGIVAVCTIIVAVFIILFGKSLAFLFPAEAITLINYLAIFAIIMSVLILW